MHYLLLAAVGVSLLNPVSTCHAEEVKEIASAQQPADRKVCREIAALAHKYDADRKLPDSVVIDGTPCPRGEAAACLLAVIDKVLAKCGNEGKDALPREDLDRIAALREALKEELAQNDGYVLRRETIEAMLAKPDETAFEYKLGLGGFLRGEGTGSLHLTDFSYTPGHGEGRFLYRVKPYVYWHPTEWLGFHAEGQGYGYSGGSHQEYSKISLYQGYVEAETPGSGRFSLKGGRQEFSYGSAFILGADSFYDGLSFDGARLRIKPVEALVIDLLAGAYATPFSGGVTGDLAGVYAAYALAEGTAVEAYVLYDSGSVSRRSGEYLNIWGLRATAALGPVALEFEPVCESGRQYGQVAGADDSVSAYGGHLDVNTDAALAGLHNHFFLSFALGSGDRAAATGTTGRREFHNPNNDTSLVGDMNVVGDMSGLTVSGHRASGLQIYTLGWGVDIAKDLNFSATGRYFLANHVEDGFSRNLGLETDFSLTYSAAAGLSVILGYDRFFTGSFFRDATGSDRDIDYGYLMVQFDLSKSTPRLARK